MEWKKVFDNVNRSVGSTYDSGVEALLDRMGLEQRRSTMDVILPILGVFGAGIAVGASLGLLFAPKRGEDLRHDLRHRLEDMRERVPTSYDEVRHRAQNVVESKTDGQGTQL